MTTLRLPAPMTLVWLLRRCAWYVGWVPMLLSLALFILWGVLLQQQSKQVAQLDALKKEIHQLATKPARPAQARPVDVAKVEARDSATPDQPVQLATLWQQLPVFADLSPRMITIASMAQKRQIALNVGDYQWQAHQASDMTHDIQQFDMRFTIQADYATCRQFMLDVLRQYPSMALTGLELRKNETVQPVIDATLTFSVFIRGGRAHGA
ncbi:hypothetical protein [Methylophilus sp. 5]|uniref:hypothetical protein n=1 Tax=Methylophilus sp. 5 TaxID=1112274 RepID=UPI000491C341|nr:hypothetical protein [Methylophilus sp. 5]